MCAGIDDFPHARVFSSFSYDLRHLEIIFSSLRTTRIFFSRLVQNLSLSYIYLLRTAMDTSKVLKVLLIRLLQMSIVYADSIECWQRLYENGKLIRGTANETITCNNVNYCAKGIQTLIVWVIHCNQTHWELSRKAYHYIKNLSQQITKSLIAIKALNVSKTTAQSVKRCLFLAKSRKIMQKLTKSDSAAHFQKHNNES